MNKDEYGGANIEGIRTSLRGDVGARLNLECSVNMLRVYNDLLRCEGRSSLSSV